MHPLVKYAMLKEALTPSTVSRLARYYATVKNIKPALRRAGFGHVEASQILKKVRELTGRPVALAKRERGIFARAARKRRLRKMAELLGLF
jgi:hypothetical protein